MMDDIDKEIEERLEDLNERMRVNALVIGLLLLVTIVLCVLFSGPATVEEPWNITEHVIDKRITYVDDFMDHENHYFIFTENYCFDVSLTEYNQLVKGKSYSKEVIKEIYNYICDYNIKYPKKNKDVICKASPHTIKKFELIGIIAARKFVAYNGYYFF